MPSRATLEPFESRRLFSFATFDPNFGSAGAVAVGAGAISGTSPDVDVLRTLPNFDGGSVALVGERQLVRLDSSGRLVTTFGKSGRLALGNAPGFGQIAVDATSGRIAIVRNDGLNTGIELYSSKGRLERFINGATIVDLNRGSGELAFDGQGRLIVATAGRVGRILPSTGTLDSSFAGDGIFEVPEAVYNGLGTYEGARVSPNGEITLSHETSREDVGPELDVYYARHFTRITAAGTLSTTFGDGGVQTVSAGSITHVLSETQDTVYNEQPLDDFVVTNTGAVIYLSAGQLRRYGGDGSIFRSAAVGSALRGGTNDGQLAVDAGNHVYLYKNGRIVRLNATNLAFDDAYNGRMAERTSFDR